MTPWTLQSMEFSRPEYWSGQVFPSPGDLPNPGIESRFPALQVDSLPAETQGKPTETGVGSLSLLQQIFPAQESNWSLRHCRWILYQLSYQGSNAGETSSVPGLGRPLEKEMAAHPSILAWEIQWRGTWRAAVHEVSKKRAQLSE